MDKRTVRLTKKPTPRPVWSRHLQRVWTNTGPMPPPTEKEKYDAIRVLEDPLNAAIPGLWDEASRIFLDAST